MGVIVTCIYGAKLDNFGCTPIDFIWFRLNGHAEFSPAGVGTPCRRENTRSCERRGGLGLFPNGLGFYSLLSIFRVWMWTGQGLAPLQTSSAFLPANLYSQFSVFTLPLVKRMNPLNLTHISCVIVPLLWTHIFRHSGFHPHIHTDQRLSNNTVKETNGKSGRL